MEAYVAYYRVSTREQGDSGLGLEAQRREVMKAVPNGTIISEHTEIESGKRNDRPILRKAMEDCRNSGATLVIAKLDRLSRNAAFICHLLDSNTPFLCADMPSITPMVMRILGAVAQEEREAISKRTKDALRSLKERGVKLGNPNAKRDLGGQRALEASIAARRRNRDDNKSYTQAVAHASALKKNGMNLMEIAGSMNENGFSAPKGGKMTATQVSRMLQTAARPQI